MSPDPARPRILDTVLVVASEDDGGAARSVSLLARYLPAHGVRPHVLLHRESPLSATLREIGTSFEIVPELIETGLRGPHPGDHGVRALALNVRRAPDAIRKLTTICASRGAAVLYSHGTWTNYLAALAATRRRTPPLVWHVRNDNSAFGTRVAGRLLARAAPVHTIIAVSASAAQPYAGLPMPVKVVHNGALLPAADSPRPSGTLRRRIGLGSDAVLAGYAGRLTIPKGITVLIDAFRLAAARLPRLHLAVVGGSARHSSTDMVATLRQQAASWGLSDRVHVMGYVDDAASDIADFDVCVVPSICRDGCPRTAIEALTFGIPVIGSRTGGIPELIRDGMNGRLVPPGAVGPLADALVALGADDESRQAMGRFAAEDARARFDARNTAAAVADILFSAAGAP